MTTRKTIALTRWTFVGKVMSLLFNMQSRLVKELRPLVIRWISSGDLMYSMVTILLYLISVLPFHTVKRAPKN